MYAHISHIEKCTIAFKPKLSYKQITKTKPQDRLGGGKNENNINKVAKLRNKKRLVLTQIPHP